MSNDKTNPSTSSAASNTPANAAPQKLEIFKTKIKEIWHTLTDEDINLYEKQEENFLNKVKEKHGVNKEDAQKRLKEIKESCGESCVDEKAA